MILRRACWTPFGGEELDNAKEIGKGDTFWHEIVCRGTYLAGDVFASMCDFWLRYLIEFVEADDPGFWIKT